MPAISAFNPVNIARAINPVKNARYIANGIKHKDAEAIARTMYWFGGLICIPVAILNPMLMNHQYKNKVSTPERHSLVFQEAANQWVSVAVQMLCYFGLSGLTGKMLGKNPENSKAFIDNTKILVANIGGFIGQGVIRPWLGSKFLMKWQDKQRLNNPSGENTGENTGKDKTDKNAPKLQDGADTNPANGANPGAQQQQPSAQEEQALQDLLRSLQQQEQSGSNIPTVPDFQPQPAPIQAPPMQNNASPFAPGFQPVAEPAMQGFPTQNVAPNFSTPQPAANNAWLSPLPPAPSFPALPQTALVPPPANMGYATANPFVPQYQY